MEQEITQPIYFTSGSAIDACRYFGKRIRRESWKEQSSFIYYVPENKYPAVTDIAKETFGENALVPYQGYFALKTGSGFVECYTFSNSDLLNSDWTIF